MAASSAAASASRGAPQPAREACDPVAFRCRYWLAEERDAFGDDESTDWDFCLEETEAPSDVGAGQAGSIAGAVCSGGQVGRGGPRDGTEYPREGSVASCVSVPTPGAATPGGSVVGAHAATGGLPGPPRLTASPPSEQAAVCGASLDLVSLAASTLTDIELRRAWRDSDRVIRQHFRDYGRCPYTLPPSLSCRFHAAIVAELQRRRFSIPTHTRLPTQPGRQDIIPNGAPGAAARRRRWPVGVFQVPTVAPAPSLQ